MDIKKYELSNYIAGLIIFCTWLLFLFCSDPKPPIIPEVDQILGIYSETAPERLIHDTNSYIGTYSGPDQNPGIIHEFVDDNAEVQEGGISKKTTVTVDGSLGQWAAWFVQWGRIGTPDTETRNMSSFEGGNLTFWIKSQINLEIGIRSGNVPPGTETSKVILSNYPPFTPDDQWHRVSIPLSDFTGSSPPKANLRQIKIFFNVASNTPSGGTGGVPKTFWIDDIRWERLVE